VQSCLKNGYRLSLPLAASLPYPSPSIIFPSALEVSAGATADTSAPYALQELTRTLRALDDGRRASDPDVKSDFEAALFAWVERESKAAAMGLAIGQGFTSDLGPTEGARSPLDEGYGADLEDSPCLGGEQYRRGSRIHTRTVGLASFHARAKALRRIEDVAAMNADVAMSSEGTAAADVMATAPTTISKEPRFTLATEVIPRIGSPGEMTPERVEEAGEPQKPQIVLPRESPEQEQRQRRSTITGPPTPYAFLPRRRSLKKAGEASTDVKATAAIDPFASLDPFALSVNDKQPITRPRAFTSPPSGSVCPRQPLPTSASGPTRFQARRPPSLRLSNLPPSGAWAMAEIRAHGKGLQGRNMHAMPVFDPRIHGPTAKSAPPQITTFAAAQAASQQEPLSPPQRLRSKTMGQAQASSSSKLRDLMGTARKASTEKAMPERARPAIPASLQIKSEDRSRGQATMAGLGLDFGGADIDASSGFPRTLPYHRGLDAPENGMQDRDDADTAAQRESKTAAKSRKHRSLPLKIESLFTDLVKPFEAGRRRKQSVGPEMTPVLESGVEAATPAAPLPATAREAMTAWARRTFEATTAKGRAAGKVDQPPSAFLASAPVLPSLPLDTDKSSASLLPDIDITAETTDNETETLIHIVDMTGAAPANVQLLSEPNCSASQYLSVTRASPVPSFRRQFRMDNNALEPSSCAITLASAQQDEEDNENAALLPALPDDAVPTGQRQRRDAQGAGIIAAARSAALAPPAPEQRLRVVSADHVRKPSSPRQKALPRAPCDLAPCEGRRAVSYGAQPRPRGPRRPSSQQRRRIPSSGLCTDLAMSREPSVHSVARSSPMIREGSQCSFGSFQGSPRAAPAQPAKGTPLLIDVSSPIFSTPAKLRRDVATSPLLAGQRSPLSRICDEASALMHGLDAPSPAMSEQVRMLDLPPPRTPRRRAAPSPSVASSTPSSAAGLMRRRRASDRPPTPLDMLHTPRSRVASPLAGGTVDPILQSAFGGPRPSAAVLAIALAAEAICDDAASLMSASTAVESAALGTPAMAPLLTAAA
jgi:hypothetical protein